ncbi:hypothetical protein DT075_16340 [Bacillus licheniformis]|nr:hypothetical protein DT075_16340 [Bacillus licheniformis]
MFTKPAADNISLGLDLQGGFEVLYEVQPAKQGDKIDRDALISTVEALNRRANVLGVSEPNIQIEGLGEFMNYATVESFKTSNLLDSKEGQDMLDELLR